MHERPHLVIITGMAGAGRSYASKALEDLGFFVIDNLPADLIGQVVSQADLPESRHDRLAVVADDLYYARDLLDLRRPVPDPNSAGRLRPLPPRTARLDRGGAPAAYRIVPKGGPAAQLEPLIEDFAASHPDDPASALSLDEETRARLRAMGYLPAEE